MVWSLKDKNGDDLEPLEFSNGKNQDDIVKEILEAIKQGHKIIFLKGVCGSGKSVIALNLAKEVGRTSIVVPVKYLQEQYKEDYTNNLKIMKDDGSLLHIANFTGRNNFDCKYSENTKADDKFLPCSIDLKKENWDLIKAYLKNNPAVNIDNFEEIEDVRRLSVAAACPYWSPVIGKDWFGDYGLRDSKQYKYKGLKDKEFIFHKREPGCGYYEQFMGYVNADVLIFNSRKYEIENVLDRKPATEVEIIDECDEFLDNLGNEKNLNLNFMLRKIDEVYVKTKEEDVKEALQLLAEITNKMLSAKWISSVIEDEEILLIKDTPLFKLFSLLIRNEFLLEHEELEGFYAIAKSFEGMMEDTYVGFSNNRRDDIIARVVNINLERKLKEFLDKNKVFVMMSGTLHGEAVLKEIFGIDDFIVIEAETKNMGTVKKNMIGKEKNCRWKDFKEGRITREEYLNIFQECVGAAEKPLLIHVNGFNDLPSDLEKEKYNISLMSRERLIDLQNKYKKGELLQMFKDGKIDTLYSTKCNRGVDLPGDMCKSILFTKYPFPGMKDVFWQILMKKDPEAFRKFYFDKAKREFMQRIYRGLRKKDDVVNLLSPDLKVLHSGF
jgi:Rad3-related DNA helicase